MRGQGIDSRIIDPGIRRAAHGERSGGRRQSQLTVVFQPKYTEQGCDPGDAQGDQSTRNFQ
jgi:hypothetical protein